MRVVVVADRQDDDPGWVGERLRELGAELVTTYRDTLSIAGDGGAAADGAAADAPLALLLGAAFRRRSFRRRSFRR